MIHGWHHDSNVCKRCTCTTQPHRKSGPPPEGLPLRSRSSRIAHTLGRQEDGERPSAIRFGVTDPIAHHQADTWGAPDELFEEVDFADSPRRASSAPWNGPWASRNTETRRRQQRGAELHFLQRKTCADATRRQFHGLPARRALCVRRQQSAYAGSSRPVHRRVGLHPTAALRGRSAYGGRCSGNRQSDHLREFAPGAVRSKNSC